MKRMLSMLMVVCLLLGVSFPAHAEDLEGGQSLVAVVSTLEELREAVDKADAGDTIAIAQVISMDTDPLETDKDIVIVREDEYTDVLIYMYSGSSISGFTFLESADSSDTISISPYSDEVTIKNCSFDNGIGHFRPYISVGGGAVNIEITDCLFNGNNESALDVRANTQLRVGNCTFTNNFATSQGGAINSSGEISLYDCAISYNTAASGGGVFCSGELIISDCQFSGNSVSNENWGKDIFCIGTLSITNELDEAAGFYEMTTGSKVDLPLVESTVTAKLAFFTTEEAEEYFRPIESEPEIEPIPDPTPEPTPTPDNDNSSQEHQEPPEDDDDGGNDDTPPKPQKPVQTPSKPNTATSADTHARMLKCGDAVIDISRSVVLAGYGDGLLHEDDPLTRAQLATIIYRLLSEETLETYRPHDSTFADVDNGAWCAGYIATLARAGIVNGTGDSKYNPDEVATWGQVLVVLSRFVEPQDYELQQIQYDGWATQAIQTAVALKWIEDDADFNPDSVISRGELVELVNGILEKY